MRKGLLGGLLALSLILGGCGGGSGQVLQSGPGEEDGDVSTTLDLPQPIVIPIISTNATPDVRLDGGAFPTTILDKGLIYLQDRDGYQTLVGHTDAIPGALTLVAGTYDAKYLHVAGGQEVPRNLHAVVTARLRLNGDSDIAAHVDTVSIRPTFTLNGLAFPQTGGELASFSLRRAGEPGNMTPLGTSQAPIHPTLVMPGVYDVIYNFVSGGSVVPINENRVLMRGVTLTTEGELPIDVPALPFTAECLIDGAPFPTSAYERGRMWLVDPETGGRGYLGDTSVSESMVRSVIPGTYDIAYEHVSGNLVVPRNPDAIVKSDVVIALGDQQSAIVDVVTTVLTPTFTLNGEAFPSSAYERGDFVLIEPGRPSNEVIVTSSSSPGSTRVIPGSYSLYWRLAAGGGIVPRNDNAQLLEEVQVTVGSDLAHDVQTVDVTPDVTVNGEPCPLSAYEHGRLYLRTDRGDEVSLGYTSDQTDSVKVIPGTYDLYYERQNGNLIVPINPSRRIASGLAVTTSGPLSVDMKIRDVTFQVLLDGLPFPDSFAQSAEILLRDPASGAEWPIPLDSEAEWKLILGEYEVVYRYENGVGIPQNSTAVVGQVTVEAQNP